MATPGGFVEGKSGQSAGEAPSGTGAAGTGDDADYDQLMAELGHPGWSVDGKFKPGEGRLPMLGFVGTGPEPSPPWAAAAAFAPPHGLRFGFRAPGSTMRLGINGAHVPPLDTRDASVDAVFDSLRAGTAGTPHLGADFVRQPGGDDLFPFPPASYGGVYPLGASEIGLAVSAMRPGIQEVLVAAYLSNVSVVLTFFTLGGGLPTESDWPIDIYPDPNPDRSQAFDTRVLAADWSRHARATIVDLLDPTLSYRFGDRAWGASADPAWDEGTYDTRDTYKLVYTQHVAYYVARMLIDLASELPAAINAARAEAGTATLPPDEDWSGAWSVPTSLVGATHFAGVSPGLHTIPAPSEAPPVIVGPGRASASVEAVTSIDPWTFGGALEGIEIFNEVNVVNGIRSNPAYAGTLWGRAAAYAAEGFYLAYNREGALPMPALWWPSLASVNDQQTLGTIQEFHVALVAEATGILGARAPIALAGLVNQDTHWYRFTVAQGSALALTMIDVVQALAGDLAPGTTVSVCETGASTAPPPSNANYPTWVVTSDPTSLASFQAVEVIRRLGVACCSGATRAAWHCLVAVPSGDFQGTGLRADDSSVTTPDQAHARLSFWTYQRWQALFAGQQGQVVFPPVPASGLYADLDPALTSDVFTVLQFAGTTDYPYAYVMFADSAYLPPPPESSTASWVVWVTIQAGTTLHFVPLLPDSTIAGPSTSTSFDPRFPADTAIWTAPVDALFLSPTTTPILVSGSTVFPVWYSTKPLAFT